MGIRKLATVALATLIALGACSKIGGGDDRAVQSLQGAGSETEAGGFDQTSADSDDGVPAGNALPASVREAQIVRTADVRVRFEDIAIREAFDRVVTVATAAGGFVLDSSLAHDGGDEARSATLTLRVPSDRFDAARRDLAELGDVEFEQITGEDVGGQLVDLGARLRNLRSQEEALRELMGKATTVGETMQVQQNLFSVREQVEQLAAQEARLQDAVAFATIRVSLLAPGASAAEPKSGLAGAIERAVSGAVSVVSAVIIVIGYLVPLAVLALAGWAALRLARRRPRPAPAAG
jgi:hypothetical protein